MKILSYPVIVMLAWLLTAWAGQGQAREYFLPRPTVKAYAVILVGASADATYTGQIRGWALRLYDTLVAEHGYGPEQIELLAGDRADPEEKRITGACRKTVIYDRLGKLQNRVRPGDRVFVFMLGHTTADTREAKFVIHGPDLTAQEFVDHLQALADQDVVVMNTTAAGFPFCRKLSQPGRVIICATRSGAEKYNTVFAGHFIDALVDHAGDRDKNRRVSMLEAFRFAVRGVENWYEDQKRIPTEHAVLDDNGDGRFSAQPQSAEADGRLSQIAYLDLLPAQRKLDLPPGVDAAQVNQLTARVLELERSVVLLRDRRARMDPDLYQDQMQKLLIDLARTSETLRGMTGTN